MRHYISCLKTHEHWIYFRNKKSHLSDSLHFRHWFQISCLWWPSGHLMSAEFFCLLFGSCSLKQAYCALLEGSSRRREKTHRLVYIYIYIERERERERERVCIFWDSSCCSVALPVKIQQWQIRYTQPVAYCKPIAYYRPVACVAYYRSIAYYPACSLLPTCSLWSLLPVCGLLHTCCQLPDWSLLPVCSLLPSL